MINFRKKLNSSDKVQIKVDETLIEQKPVVKYLGVNFDEHLDYSKEVNKIVSKMACGIKAIQNLKYFLPLKSKINLMKSIVLSHINYSAILLTGITNRQCMLINKQINRAIKICTGNSRMISTTFLLKKYGLIPSDLILKLRCTEFLWKIDRGRIKSFKKLNFPYTIRTNARTKNITVNIKPKTSYFQNSFIKRATSLQNSVPKTIWSVDKNRDFRKDLYHHVSGIFKGRPPDRQLGATWKENTWI